VIAEYIWIDGALGMRAKSRTLTGKISSIADIPEWNYDGSSTY
jgi:glutamine synthetase